jgi:GNAT superfamily N-acetyltransferase
MEMYLQKIEHNDNTLFLLTRSLTDVKGYITEHIDILSYIEVVYSGKILTISFLYTYPKFQNKGYASILLTVAAKLGKEKGIFFIEVDDMSRRYRRMKSNFYVNRGFRYVSSQNGPEMTAHISGVNYHDIVTDDDINDLLTKGHTELQLSP